MAAAAPPAITVTHTAAAEAPVVAEQASPHTSHLASKKLFRVYTNLPVTISHVTYSIDTRIPFPYKKT